MDDLAFGTADRFYKRLNPEVHFTRSDGEVRVASSAFKLRGFASSVDAERLLGPNPQAALDAERRHRDREHPGYGLGLFEFGDLPPDATVKHAPTEANGSHCNLTLPNQTAARRLATRVRLVERPERALRVGRDEYVDPSMLSVDTV